MSVLDRVLPIPTPYYPHQEGSVKDHTRCDRIRMLLADVGLDPERMMCSENHVCVLGFGVGAEGFTLAKVERLCDRAIELAGRA